MSVLSSLSKNHLFGSVEEILLFIKKVEVEDSVYLRRDKPIQSVVSYNKDIKNKNKMDEKWLFKRLTYVCPHYGSHRDRSKTKERLNQNVMPQGCPVKVQFTFCSRQEKFYIASKEVVHQNHPVSAQHVTTYARKRHMAPEALAFAEATLSTGAQPSKVRKLLQDKFGSHLITKDLINIKQTLAGKSKNDVIVDAVVTSPTGLHPTKHKNNPTTEKDQFNEAMIFFKKLADTISVLSTPDFNHKMHLFGEIHSLIKEDKPVKIMQNPIPSAVSIIPSPTFVGDSVSHVHDDPSTSSAVQVESVAEESGLLDSTEKKDLHHPCASQ